MQEQVVRIASHTPHAAIFAAVACVLAVLAFVLLKRAQKTILAWMALVGLIVIGLAPLTVASYVRSQGVYRLQVFVIKPDHSLADSASVKASNSGVLKMIDDGWELVIPRQARPVDGKVTLSASLKDEFLSGSSTVVLSDDYYPTAKIQLVPETLPKIHGVVVDEELHAVPGATVTVAGYTETALTDKAGNFSLPLRMDKGQVIAVQAQKGELVGRLSIAAGKPMELILSPE